MDQSQEDGLLEGAEDVSHDVYIVDKCDGYCQTTCSENDAENHAKHLTIRKATSSQRDSSGVEAALKTCEAALYSAQLCWQRTDGDTAGNIIGDSIRQLGWR